MMAVSYSGRFLRCRMGMQGILVHLIIVPAQAGTKRRTAKVTGQPALRAQPLVWSDRQSLPQASARWRF